MKMKANKKFVWMASWKAMREFVSMKEFAEETVARINKKKSGAVELSDPKSDGFILRQKTDESIGEGQIYKALADSVAVLIKKNSDDVSDFLSDNYEIEYNADAIDTEFAQEIFEVSKNGRLIYVEDDT